MDPRFSTWTDLGSVTLGPTDTEVVIGAVTLAPGANTLWVRVTHLQAGPWPWSYGILSFKNSEGRPMGSTKAYGHLEGEVSRLGVGLAPTVSDGFLVFEPRSFNLAWIKRGNPWPLSFQVLSGTS